MNLQPVFDIPEICAQMGIKYAVISPGSRNGALTIAFARHPKIRCFSVTDERSAAFIGLGMSLHTKVPTVLICTSGSAGLNYAPAVAEAFFNRVPLLLLTADRPEELVNIRDGQTIFQKELYGRHVKHSFEFPTLADNKNQLQLAHEMTERAINACVLDKPGPVHLNIPFREPFYPKPETHYQTTSGLNFVLRRPNLNHSTFPKKVVNYEKIVIVAGQGSENIELTRVLSEISLQCQIPVVADIISNLSNTKSTIQYHDFFLNEPDDESLHPDLILTFGLSVLSKKLKILLRNSKAQHWHIDVNLDSADTFGLLEHEIAMEPKDFFAAMPRYLKSSKNQQHFYRSWTKKNNIVHQKLIRKQWSAFCDAHAYYELLNQIPENSDLHLANSMAVRYANLFGISSKNIEIFCNRGTSGIDGTNSTALGSSIVSNRKTYLLTGDVAFFYDRNAFWHNHVSMNINVIVFNNGGGGIFRLIQGPSEHPELEPFFETNQRSNAKALAEEFEFEYLTCKTTSELKKTASRFFSDSSKRKLLEIFTEKEENERAFKELMLEIQ